MLPDRTDKEEPRRYIAEAFGSSGGDAALHLCHLSRPPPHAGQGRELCRLDRRSRVQTAGTSNHFERAALWLLLPG